MASVHVVVECVLLLLNFAGLRKVGISLNRWVGGVKVDGSSLVHCEKLSTVLV